ncbi:MAG TPA: UbiA family prenyltransferase [Euzebyales bacterium]|nr:UbiA family prenyltransferase [Euzebyales bacterium]
MLRRLGPLLRAAHPEPSAAVTLAATALAVGAGLGARSALVMLAVGSGQLSIGWSNDWLDRHRDRAGHRLDKPVAQHEVAPRTVLGAALSALIVCVAASFALGVVAAVVHLTGVAAGWIYNVVAKRSAFSIVPWMVAFGLLPAVVTLTEPLGRWPAWWIMAAGAVLGGGAHLANAIPDLEHDRATGVEGLPHRLGRRRALWFATILVATGVALVTYGATSRAAATLIGVSGAIGLAWIVAATLRGRDRAAFRGVVALLLLLTFGVVLSGAALA